MGNERLMMGIFRALTAGEVECRVGNCTENGVSVLLYKTARTDYAVLDETFGPFGWCCSYETVNGNLFCSISCRDATRGGEWVTKSNCGTESNQEAEKGEASDAFKRAGFTWGIGRELYTAPFIWVPAAKLTKLRKNQNGRWQCLDKFEVTHMEVSEGRITALAIACNGKLAYSMGQNAPKAATPAKPATERLAAASAAQGKVSELVKRMAVERGVSEAKVCGALDAHPTVVKAEPERKEFAKIEVLEHWLSKARA